MKPLFFLFLAISILGCQETTHDKTQAESPEVKKEFDWLLGNWMRTNNQEGTKTYEYWSKNEQGEYHGLGCTLQGKDTVFKENLRLVKVEEVWNLEVKGVNGEPTFFAFTQQNPSSFVCENPNNEFPQKIDYTLKDGELTATISAGSKEVSFFFEKMQLAK